MCIHIQIYIHTHQPRQHIKKQRHYFVNKGPSSQTYMYVYTHNKYVYTHTNLDSILKSRDIILSTKVHLVKHMIFPIVMNGCEKWTIKKAEHRRIDAFELWCWGRVFRIP